MKYIIILVMALSLPLIFTACTKSSDAPTNTDKEVAEGNQDAEAAPSEMQDKDAPPKNDEAPEPAKN